MQEKEVRKKRKYETKDLVITLTEDDVDLVVEKFQDRGEEVVLIVESQHKEIITKIIQVHENLQQLQT
jgi:nucleoside-triphosphatase THEP1